MSPRLGVALGAGGARGLCHIGVLQALEARGRAPDALSGSSIGALVGACYAAGRLAALEEWARGLTRFGALSLWDVDLRSGGIIKARALDRLFRDIDLPETFDGLRIPLAVTATDMVTGAPVVMHDGSLFDAVRASIALPGLISPHRHGDRWLLDGGVVDPIPVAACRALGVEVVIASNPNARLDGVIWRDDARHPQENTEDVQGLAATLGSLLAPVVPAGPVPPGYVAVVSAAIEIMMDHIQRGRMAGDPPHVQLNGTLGDMGLADMHLAARAIAEGIAMVGRQAEFIDGLMTN
ncbi:MAG: patatin-like phospholipase family protein [Shimia sp.]